MIAIKLWGGLGNQLFQYMFGYSLANMTGDDLIFDIAFYDKQPKYVGKRNIDLLKLFPNIKITKERKHIVSLFENGYLNKLIRIFPNFVFNFLDTTFIKETRATYNPHLLLIEKERYNYFDGYWQTSKYFCSYKEELLGLLKNFGHTQTANNHISTIAKTNSVSIHIRKGDFSSSYSYIGYAVSDDYYKMAIRYMETKLDSPTFFIFTDDKEYIEHSKILEGHKYFIVDNDEDDAAVEDLLCMTKCKHGIMSASTFSWWGNWLKNDGAIIIAPKGKYFNEYFCENSWIRM